MSERVSTDAPSHPIRLVLTDDLRRSRVTVFFRFLLALPHLLWLGLWSTVAFVIAFINWIATLVKGRSPSGLHDFLAGYLRYATQIEAYLLLAANPYPAFFVGSAKPYPVDLQIDPPAPQRRWKTLIRLVLALPALVLAGAFVGGPIAWAVFRGVGMAGTAAFLVWFAALVRGQAPRGLRDVTAWSIGYGAQAGGYLFLLTDRYPYTGPETHLDDAEAVDRDERRPILENTDDLRRSRVTVFFRLPLAVPHIVWLLLWTVVALFAAVANWIAALVIGRSPRPLARFLAAWVRYAVHVESFLYLAGNPFPGFVGKRGSYPLDLELDPFARQHRLITLFRLFLAVPALLLAGAIGSVALIAAVFAWFVALIRGRMPAGLQKAIAYSIGYTGQLRAYGLVLTDRYPHASPMAVLAGLQAAQLTLPVAQPEALNS